MTCVFLYRLTKNLTSQLHCHNHAVLPEGAMKKKKEKAVSAKEAFKLNFWAYKQYFVLSPWYFIISLVKVIISKATPYIGVYLSAMLITELVGDRDPERLKGLVIAIVCSAAVITLLDILLSKLASVFEIPYSLSSRYNIYGKKFLSLDFSRIDDPKTHELFSLIKQNQTGGGWGIQRLPWQVESLIGEIIGTICGGAVGIGVFTSIVPESAGRFTVLNSPFFTVFIIVLLFMMTVIAPIINTAAGKISAKYASTHNLANRLFGFFGFFGSDADEGPDVRIYNFSKFSEKYILDKTDPFHSKGIYMKLAKKYRGPASVISNALLMLFKIVIYAYVCLKAYFGAFGIGLVTQYITSVTMFCNHINSLIDLIGNMYANAEFIKLSYDFLTMPNDMYQGSLTVEKRRDRNYEVEFKNVSFKYPGAKQYSLQNVSLKFRVGEKLAVVGQNGSGKTTFIKLLCRLYDPTEGEILLNGINIRKYDYKEYMSIFSVVFQDYKLFAYKLGENVACSSSYDRERAKKCLRDVGFGDRLETLPDGLDTYLYKNFDNAGVNISGGEAQKIALARAVYKDSPFIILDEPTASLDPKAEAEIYSNTERIVGDRTAIYISHRLSSCRFCTEILVFDKGTMVQQGSHDALLADAGGKYHELWYAQAQYYDDKQEA